MLDDRDKRRRCMLEERKKRENKRKKQTEEKGVVWKLFFEPDPEFAKFFSEPIPWLIGLALFCGVGLIALELFEFFIS